MTLAIALQIELFPRHNFKVILGMLIIYCILAYLALILYRAFRVWRTSLASRYEQQCQRILRAYNLQLSRVNSDGKVEQAVQLGFVRRMSRRLVVFMEAYRAEYRARKALASATVSANRKPLKAD